MRGPTGWHIEKEATVNTDPNTRFIQELGYHGFAFGSEPSAVEDDLVEDVARYIAAPTAPAGSGMDLHDLDPELTPRDACLALIAGARHAAAKAREIEVTAAQIARLLQPPVTVRELANQAGITERAAATRYPNPQRTVAVEATDEVREFVATLVARAGAIQAGGPFDVDPADETGL